MRESSDSGSLRLLVGTHVSGAGAAGQPESVRGRVPILAVSCRNRDMGGAGRAKFWLEQVAEMPPLPRKPGLSWLPD